MIFCCMSVWKDPNHEGTKAHLNALYELKTTASGVGSCSGSVGVVIHEADSPIVVLVNDFVCLGVFYCGLRLKKFMHS